MVSHIFRSLYIFLTFTHKTHGYHYCYHGRTHMNLIGVILELNLTSRRKPRNFSICVKWNTFVNLNKFQINILSVEEAFCLTSIFEEDIPS